MFGTPRRWANPNMRLKSPDTHVVAFAERFRTRGQCPAPPPITTRAVTDVAARVFVFGECGSRSEKWVNFSPD